MSGNPLSDMVLSGEAIEAAAKDPNAIGRLLIDMAFSEGKNIGGDAMYIERKSNKKRLLGAFETGFEDLITGGWVRVITPKKLFTKEKGKIKEFICRGDAVDHGVYRGVTLIEFCIIKSEVFN